MFKHGLKKQMHGCLYLLNAIAFFVTSCVDKNFDLSKDIDMTLGVGNEGLSVKLGTTEKILLKDIIEEDENVKVDGESRYYLIEKGNFETNFDIKSVSSEINPITFETDEIINYADIKKVLEDKTGIAISENEAFQVPKGLKANGTGNGGASFDYDLRNIDKAIVRIAKVYPRPGTEVSLDIALDQASGLGFALDTIRSLEINLPQFLPVSKENVICKYPYVLEGNTLKFTNVAHVELNQSIINIRVDYFALMNNGVVENGSITLPPAFCNVNVKGELALVATKSFSIRPADKVCVRAKVAFVDQYGNDNRYITVHKVLGNFNPEINPNIDPIDVSSSLPDFLKDDDVRVGGIKLLIIWITIVILLSVYLN